MEAACFNMLEEGEVVLVAQTGIWGERFSDMAERNGKCTLIGHLFSLTYK